MMTDHNADAGGGGFGSPGDAIAATSNHSNEPPTAAAAVVDPVAAAAAAAAAAQNDLALLRANGFDAAAEEAKNKRTAARQINSEQYNSDDEFDQTVSFGAFAKADPATLAKRRIVKVRRPEGSSAQTATSSSTTTAASTSTSASSNPFASLSLPTPSVTSTTSTSSNPFANIVLKACGSTSSSTDAGSVFGSGSGFLKFNSGVFGGTSANTETATSATTTTAAITPFAFGGGAAAATTTSNAPAPFLFGSGAATSNGSGTSWFSPSTSTTPFAFAAAAPAATGSATTSGETGAAATTTENKKEILPEHVELSTGEEGEELIIETRVRTHKRVLESELNGASKGSGSTNTGGSEQDGSTPSVPPSSSTAPMLSKQIGNGDDKAAVDQDNTKGATTTSNTEGGAAKAKDSESEPSQTATAAASSWRWQEVGIGPLRLLERTANATSRLVQRRESTPNGPATKVILNVPLWKETTVQRPSEKHVQITTLGYDDTAAALPVPETYLFKLKTPADAAELYGKLEESVAKAKSCVVGDSSNSKDEGEQQQHP